VKALALKEICKASLMYAESLFRMYLGVKMPKSTPHYWEVRHGDAVEDMLKALNLLRNRPAGAREAGLSIPSAHSARMMMSEAEPRVLERVEAARLAPQPDRLDSSQRHIQCSHLSLQVYVA